MLAATIVQARSAAKAISLVAIRKSPRPAANVSSDQDCELAASEPHRPRAQLELERLRVLVAWPDLPSERRRSVEISV